jgi:Ni/Co efflux regulator RcnB
MRKLILSLLLASAVTAPAFADPGENRDRHGARAERSEPSSDRAERQAARAERQEERQQANVERPQFTGNRGNGGNTNNGANVNVQAQQFEARARAHASMAGEQQNRAERDAQQQDTGQRGNNWRDRHQDRSDGFVQPAREAPNVLRGDRNRTPVVSDVPRPGTQPRLRTDGRRWTDNHNWNRNWRNDNRYDWRRYRDHNRSRFHFGFYNDPFGWGYQPFSIGWRLWPNYYSSNYWINDPWQYRLPYAPPGTRWVRYYNDALLVDVYSGQVVDVIYSFFW